MNQSEQINELVAALSKAQAKMKPAVFNKVNPHFKSRYADFTSCMDACREPLAENGLCVMQCIDMINDKAVLITMLAHSSGQWVKSFFPLIPKNHDSQSFGSALTYGKRYGLSALLGIVSDDDDDDANAACAQQNKPVVPIQKISKEQAGVLIKKLDQAPKCKENIKAWLDKQSIMDWFEIPVNIYESLIKAADDAIKQASEKAA